MRFARVVAVLVLFLGILIPTKAQEVVATWTGGSGNWSDAADWGTNPVVPNNGGGTTYSVAISAPGSSVTLDVLSTIDNLTLAAGNSLTSNSGGGLTLVSGSSSNSGTL